MVNTTIRSKFGRVKNAKKNRHNQKIKGSEYLKAKNKIKGSEYLKAKCKNRIKGSEYLNTDFPEERGIEKS